MAFYGKLAKEKNPRKKTEKTFLHPPTTNRKFFTFEIIPN
jgi:hypothetical protein